MVLPASYLAELNIGIGYCIVDQQYSKAVSDVLDRAAIAGGTSATRYFRGEGTGGQGQGLEGSDDEVWHGYTCVGSGDSFAVFPFFCPLPAVCCVQRADCGSN